MTDKIKEEFDKFYDELISMPMSVLHIFEDYYGEDRVELQGFPSRDELLEKLNTAPIKYFIGSNLNDVINRTIYRTYSSEERDIVNTLWDESVYEESVLCDAIVTHYILPLMKVSIILKYVDKLSILVYFPKVRITNEYDKYVDIKDLWVRVWIKATGSGTGYFGLNRSHYPLSHFMSGYLHSHISGIPKSDFTYFATPCTGSGPINATMASLSVEYDESLWALACLEIDRYVKTESISGGPFYRLEQINDGSVSAFNAFPLNWMNHETQYGYGIAPLLKDFIKQLLDNNVLRFNYVNGSYGMAMSLTDIMIVVSNEFIKFYNQEYYAGKVSRNQETLISEDLIKRAKIIGGVIYYIKNSDVSTDYTDYIGEKICEFKGKTITLKIESMDDREVNTILLLNHTIVEAIIGSILRVLNYNYGRAESSETEAVKRVRYF